jgi:integrase
MARRARGDGSVFYDAARGCWVGSVDIGRDPQTGRRRRRKVSAATKTECREKLDELRAEKKRTSTVARRDTTVGQVVDEWLANLPPEIASPISVRCQQDAGRRIKAELARVRISSLEPGQVERLLNGMAKSGYSTVTIGQTLSTLRRAIRRAQRDGKVGRNVAELVDVPQGTRRQSRSMTIEQVERLLSADLSAWWSAYLFTGIMAGLRPGELLGLRWEDADTAGRVIRVRKSVKMVPATADAKSHVVIADLKTDRSRRTLEMPAAVASMLSALRREQAAGKLRLGAAYADHGLVFPRPDGRPCRPEPVRRQFKAICEAAGLGTGWHPHETRHSFVSILSDAGVDIDRIADAAGHINSNVTKTVYRHVLADKLSDAARVMDTAFRASRGAS